jgi:hypothetical protein
VARVAARSLDVVMAQDRQCERAGKPGEAEVSCRAVVPRRSAGHDEVRRKRQAAAGAAANWA